MADEKIVVIEDSRLYRQVLKQTLSQAGYQIETAENGQAGVELALRLLPDLVITDMDMPLLCGEEVCRRLKAEAATQMIPIIMLTASKATDKITQLDAGADDYLPKSQDLAELLAKVRVFLRIKHLQDQLREQNNKLRYENDMNEMELRLAREVQRGLLPREGGRHGRLQVAFRYLPMRWVGGDLFDVVAVAGGNTVVFVSDVAGHGVSAALVTAMIKTSVLGQASQIVSLAELVQRVNGAISHLMSGDRFVTAFFGLLGATGTGLQYVNAGHPPGLLIRAGDKTISRLGATGCPMGVWEDQPFDPQEVSVAPGDRLILYTDGITEAPNEANVRFGTTRFEHSVLAHCQLEVDALVERVIEDLVRFCGRNSFDDDVNLVACEVLGEPRP
jgi:serine phosphatase RsbU (regulator of sigma subunit)